MTEEICSSDAYATTCVATVREVREEGIVLDRTVFYARGGGQPGDTGTLSWDGSVCAVTDTVRKSGVPVHVVDGEVPPVGTSVTASIDWDRRLKLMRSHTALHVLSAVIWQGFGAKATGGNIDVTGARMDFELDSMSMEFGRQVEERLNEQLSKDVPISVVFMPRADAVADPDLIRTKVNLVPEAVDPIRVIDIEDVDKQADGGTHVRATGEVGPVRVVKTESKGKANKRIRIELAD